MVKHLIFRMLAVFLATTLAVGTLVGCSKAEVTEYDYTRVYVDGQGTLGVAKRGEAPRALVVYFHGLDSNEMVLLDEHHKPLTDLLVNAGYAVVASNAGGNSFGNPRSQRDYAELARVAREQYRTGSVYLLAESMGAVAAVNLLAESTDPTLRGLVAISPALDLASAPEQYQQAIAAAYPEGTMEQSNPIALAPDLLAGKRMRFYASDGDTLVQTAHNADAFRDRFASVADISVVPCSGGHLDPSCVQPEDIAKWFLQS